MYAGRRDEATMYEAGRLRSLVVLAVLAWAMSALAGCDYESSLDGLQCSADEQCPEGAMCDDGFCVEAPSPRRVELTPAEPTVIDQGESLSLQASVLGEDGESYDRPIHYEWSIVGDDSLVTLDETQGEETTVTAGESPGTVVIRVSVDGLAASVPVTVSDLSVSDVVVEALEGVEVSDEGDWSIEEGAQGRLQAQVFGLRDGQQVELEHRHVRWESSDPSVLKVDSDGVIYAERTASEPVEIIASAGANDISHTVAIEVVDRTIDQVAIIPGDLQMTAGHQISLSAQAFSNGVRIERGLDEFDWQIDGQGLADLQVEADEVIVTADTDLGGDDLRTATVQASLDDGEDVIEIRVVQQLDDGINISPSVLELREGQTTRLSATVVDEGVIQSGAEVEWSIEDGADVLAILGAEAGEDVEVEALSPGEATVRAEKPGSGLAAVTAQVTVQPAPIIAMTIKPSFVELVLGPDDAEVEIELFTLAEQVLDAAAIEDDSNIDNEDIQFSAGSVVNVVRTGAGTARLETTGEVGTTQLVVTYPDAGVEDSIGVVVVPEAVESVSIDQSDLSMSRGDQQTLTASVTPNIVDYPEQVVWWSDDQSVVQVGTGGLTQGSSVAIEAVDRGDATITAFLDGRFDTIEVSVDAAFEVMGDDDVDVGDTLTLEAQYDGEDVSADATWGSEDSSIATVDQNGLVTGVSEGSVEIYAAHKGLQASMTITVDDPYEVVIDEGISEPMAIGDTEQLSATVLRDDSAVSCFDGDLEWFSSSPGVASVDSSGNVTAHSAGTTQIHARCGSTQSDAETVEVSAPQITFVDAPFDVAWGQQQVIEADIEHQGNCQPVWTSAQPELVGVESSGTSATIHGHAETTSAVTVTLHCGGVSETAEVTVSNPYEIQIVAPSNQMEVGEVMEITIIASAQGCPSEFVEWSSSESSVAVVDNDGIVSAAGVGSADIEARCGSERDTVSLEIYELSGISIVQEDQVLDLGDTQQLEAFIDYDGPGSYDDECTPQWTSADEAVATVDGGAAASGGEVTLQGQAVGETTIALECGGLQDSLNVTVQYGEEIQITSPTDGFRMEVGQTHEIDATVDGGDAAANCAVPLQWSSDVPSVASVDSDGVVEAVSGHEVTATITVTCGYESDQVEIEVISEPDALVFACDEDAEADGDCEQDPGPPNQDFDFVVDRQNGALDVDVLYDGQEFEGCTPFWAAEAVGSGQVQIDQSGAVNASADADEAQLTVTCGGLSDSVDVSLQDM